MGLTQDYIMVKTTSGDVWSMNQWILENGAAGDVICFLEGTGSHWAFHPDVAEVAMRFKLTWA
jgi:hypothetical protein